ncbi:MAG: DUF1833 domain-containing protein [Deltaproteobacteria bacterium]|nr:MAG: DUF1833 domain-containing protein [Deltaproteobacteria bacterium]
MSRTVSSAALNGMLNQTTDEAFLLKLKISHPDFSQTFYFINDQVNHTDQAGQEWIGYPFAVTLPDDTSTEVAEVTLTIDNVDRQIIQEIRAIAGEPTVELWVVLGSDIDDVVAGPFTFSLYGVTWDALTISGRLGFEPILNLPWPADRFTPATCPGLFWQ